MRVVAGCDGGGTKCTIRVAVVQDNHVVRTGQASAGSANIKSNPLQALRSIREALRDALLAAELPPDQAIDHFVAALAGAGAKELQQVWQEKLECEFPIQTAIVLPDIVALFAAVDNPNTAVAVADAGQEISLTAGRASRLPSIATVVGTGSIAWAQHPDGRMIRAGGLGPECGDEGSGYWIGKEALERCRGATDSHLAALLHSHIDTASPPQTPHALAQLARLVFEASKADETAKAILTSAAQHIAQLIVEVASKLGPQPQFSWICAGGVAVHQPEWLASVRDICASQGIALTPPALVREPVAGALALALSRKTKR